MWDKFCLKQLGCFNELKNGYAFKSSDYQNSGIPLIKIGNIKNCRLDYSHCDYLPENFINDYSKFLLREDDLIIAMSGATTGKIAVVNKKNLPAFLNQRVGNLGFLNRDIICESYLPYVEIQIKKQLMALASGSAMPNISKGIIERLQILLPPLDDQRRIVARIEELVGKVEEARGLRRQSVEYGLPSLRNGIFRKAFQGKFLDYSATEFHKDELPSIGKWVKLGDICSLITDGTHQTPTYTEKGMMFLSAQNIKPYRFMPKNHKYVSYEDYLAYTARNKVQKGDILITRVGAGIGEVAMVDQDIDFAIYVSLGHIRAIQDFVYTPYLVHWLNSPAGVAQSREKILGRGHSQGNLNLNLIRQFLVPLPSLPEQHRIVAYLNNLQAKVNALKRLQTETAAELDALLPSILDKAFKGEL
jgi:restriction endonuclease S subunit